MYKLIGAITVVLAVSAGTQAWADSVRGKVIAYDRVAKRIVLSDKSVFELASASAVPDTLDAGDEVEIDFEGAGESGIGKIQMISIVNEGN